MMRWWYITRVSNPTIDQALISQGVLTLYRNKEAAWQAHSLYLNRKDKKEYTVKPIDVREGE